MSKADRIEEIARAVEIDPVALVEIQFGFTGDDCRQMEDDIRAPLDELLGFAGSGKVAFACNDRSGKTCGLSGATTSTSVSFSTEFAPRVPSLTSRCVSLRPTMPAAPMIRICMNVSSLSEAACDQVFMRIKILSCTVV